MKDFEVPAEIGATPEAAATEAPPGVTKHGVPDDAKSKTVSKLTDTQRTFRPGEMLDLSDNELLGLNITVAKFVDGLLRSVDSFGRAQLGEGA